MQFEDSFFETEVRCGFEISPMMKRAWAAELEILKIIIDLCEENNLTYFADWGTLLGAVRHKGYVPWDDDIDICLKREDYNRLIQILPHELPTGVEMFGIHATNDRYYKAQTDASQLRVCAVRDLWDINEYIRYFHGYPFSLVGIDIFPLDIVPRDDMAYQAQNKLLSVGLAIVSNWNELKAGGSLENRLTQFEELSGITIPQGVPEEYRQNHVCKLIDAISGLCREEEGDKLTEYIFSHDNPARLYEKDWYKDAILVPFETIEIAIPCGYERILRGMYGDYTVFREGASAHDYPFYQEMEREMKDQISNASIPYTLDELCDKVERGEITLILD